MNYRCPRCGGTFASPSEGMVRCPLCEGEVLVAAPEPAGTAWDRASAGRWAEAFFADVRDSLMDPIAHFERVGRGHGWARPWFFAVIISVAVFIIAIAYQLGFQALAVSVKAGFFFPNVLKPFMLLSVPLSIVAMGFAAIVGIPIVTTVGLFLQTLIFHLCLMLLGAARRPFDATFRVVCYAMGPQLFQIVPLFGGVVAGAWQMVLSVIGLKVVHQTSYARSALAVFLPAIACCGAIVLALVALSGWTVAAIFSSMH